MEWKQINYVDSILKSLSDVTKLESLSDVTKLESLSVSISTRSARLEGTSMNEIKSIKQYSILISIEHSGMN